MLMRFANAASGTSSPSAASAEAKRANCTGALYGTFPALVRSSVAEPFLPITIDAGDAITDVGFNATVAGATVTGVGDAATLSVAPGIAPGSAEVLARAIR